MNKQNNKSILIVDDNLLMLKVIEKNFADDGFICYTAGSAEEGLEVLQRTVPSVILSDYEMPGLNGFEFREKVLAHERTQHIPFVFLTAHDNTQLRLKGLDLQAIDYITKDTPFPVIVSKVNNILLSLRQQHLQSVEELKKAANALQYTAVPRQLPVLDEWELHYMYQSFQDYPGGDFIDCIKVNQHLTYCVIGDVVGKKWKAWFFTFGILSYIRSAIRLCVLDNQVSPAAILQKINYVIGEDETLQDILCSLGIILIDTNTSHVLYAGAGDLPLLIYRQQQQVQERVQHNGILLGLQKDATYTDIEITLQKGDIITAFTDGLIDMKVNDVSTTDYDGFALYIQALLKTSTQFTYLKQALEQQTFIDDATLLWIKNI